MPILHKLLQKLEGDGVFLSSLYKDNIILIIKPDSHYKKRNYRLISFMNVDTNVLNLIL